MVKEFLSCQQIIAYSFLFENMYTVVYFVIKYMLGFKNRAILFLIILGRNNIMMSRLSRKQEMHIKKKNEIKKNIAVTGTAMLGLGLATNLANSNDVQAAVTSNADHTQVQTVKSTDQQLDDNIKDAQDDVNNAQDNADQTQEDADNAKDTADNSQNTADNAQDNANNAGNSLDDAKDNEQNAQDNANNATDDNIKDAQDDVDHQKDENEQLGQDVENGQSDVNDAQDNVDNAQNNANNAQGEADQSDKDVNNAQDGVDDAQDNINNGSADADKNLDDAQNNLDDAKGQENQAQGNADQADKNESQAQKDADAAQKAKEDAQKAQAAAQAKADAAQKAQDAAQKALDDAKNNQAHENANHITVSQDYKNALNAFQNANPSDANYAQLLANVLKAAEANFKANGSYISDSTNEAIKINNQADLDKYMDALNRYAQQLINEIRNQFGTTNVQVSGGSEQLGQDMGHAYTDNNWDGANGHDNATNSSIAQNHGLTGLSDQDMYSGATVTHTDGTWGFTLDDFMQNIYDSIMQLIFNDADSNWGHATSMAGIRASQQGNDQWFGLGFGQFNPDGDYQDIPNTDNMVFFNTLFNFVYDYTIIDGSKFDTTPIKTQGPSADEIKQLESDLAGKTTASNTAKQVLATAKANTAKAVTASNNANQALATAKAKQSAAHTALVNAQAATKAATVAVEAAQKAANDAHKSDAEKQQALADAQAALKAAQAVQAQKHAALATANAALSDAKKALDTAKAQLVKAEAALKAGEKALADKTAKLGDLTNAESQLEAAKKAVEDAQKAYDDAVATAKEAQAAADADDATYQALQKVADDAKQALADA